MSSHPESIIIVPLTPLDWLSKRVGLINCRIETSDFVHAHGNNQRFLFLIDGHSDFDVMVDVFAKKLPTLAKTPGWSAAILFVSPHTNNATPPLDSTEGFAPSLDRREAINQLREAQFFVRMVASYGWGAFCHCERIQSFINRISASPDVFLTLTPNDVQLWETDVARILKVITDKIPQGRAIDCNMDDQLPDKPPHMFPAIDSNITLLRYLAKVHEFGRIDPQAGKKISDLVLPPACRATIERLNRKIMTPPPSPSWLDISTLKLGNQRQIARAQLVFFEILQDLSQMLSKGTAPWAQRSRSTGPLRVLAIKDYTDSPSRPAVSENEAGESLERERISAYFAQAFEAAFRPGDIDLHCIDGSDSSGGPIPAWDTHKWWRDRLIGNKTLEARKHPGKEVVKSRITDYDIVLIEAEYQTRFVGPSIIHWLDHALDELRLATDGETSRRPQLFVLSRDESAGHSFMCLWLGAQAFASKSRVFGIPALLTMANVGQCSTVADSKKLRPNFFAIEGLIPHQRNRLQSRRREHMVLGDQWDKDWVQQLPKADLHFHIGTSISLEAIIAMAANTTGYCVPAGGEAQSEAVHSTYSTQRGRSIDDVIEKVCKIVLMANLVRLHSDEAMKKLEPYQVLWCVARFVLQPIDKRGNIVDKTPPSFGALEQIVRWLVREDRPVREFEACSIVVVAISVFERFCDPATEGERFGDLVDQLVKGVGVRWYGLEMLDRQFTLTREKEPNRLSSELGGMLEYYLRRIAENWSDPFTASRFRTLIRGEADSARSKYLGRMTSFANNSCRAAFEKVTRVFDQLLNKGRRDQIHSGIPESRTDGTEKWISNVLAEFKNRKGEFLFGEDAQLIHVFENDPTFAVKQLRKRPDCIVSLAKVVKIPESTTSARSLQRYLIGSGILGADHLQLPENILLAGIDIVRQNVLDNVVYSELRCSTTGYTRGGMNYYDATDLLCLSFDLGALLFGGARRNGDDGVDPWWSAPPQRWVRTNILLGAKRHKPREIDDVVALVRHYLERGAEVTTRRRERDATSTSEISPGRWWRRCAVVGFDLSGKESDRIEGLRAQVEPLFRACAPITIHAGEAMTADSIWEAVHDLGAQRIGHGLRLRENAELLEHCVRRGICMELCPISNDFTNVFMMPVTGSKVVTDLESDRDRDRYPIMDFLSAGLDVCLNTDNRSLHAEGTLTDEYLRAAKLSGGLSRWDVLRICKAGFKAAFLPKDQVAALLRHVEYEIYKIASEHSGENFFPPIDQERGG